MFTLKIKKNGVFVVKNTIFWHLGEIFCPQPCLSCGKYGGILCECCKKYITSAHVERCLSCGELLWNSECLNCPLPFKWQFHLGKRIGALKELVNNYKYNSVRSCSEIISEMVARCVSLPENVVLVPLPTISKHICERGFDHTWLLVRHLARLERVECARLFVRGNNATQVGADADKRKEQAKTAYILKGDISRDKYYILVDDVWTTGSSMLEAARRFREREITRVGAMIIAKSG